MGDHRVYIRDWIKRQSLPWLTPVVTLVATVAAVGQYAVPAMIPALQRTPEGLPNGEYWRLVTPLLVQTLGWYQVLVNLATLGLIGTVTEWSLGRRWWIILAAAGTFGGELAAYQWHDWGGGDSILIAGLAGGVLVNQLFGRTPPVWWATEPVLYYTAALAGWGVHGPTGSGLAVAATAATMWGLRRISGSIGYRLAIAAFILVSVALCLRSDLHGAALTASIVLSGFLVVGRFLADRFRGPESSSR